jgi:hypothetical protein
MVSPFVTAIHEHGQTALRVLGTEIAKVAGIVDASIDIFHLTLKFTVQFTYERLVLESGVRL